MTSIAEIKEDLELLKSYDERIANGSIVDGRKYVEQMMSTGQVAQYPNFLGGANIIPQ